jgi:hypothetical protein
MNIKNEIKSTSLLDWLKIALFFATLSGGAYVLKYRFEELNTNFSIVAAEQKKTNELLQSQITAQQIQLAHFQEQQSAQDQTINFMMEHFYADRK